MRVQWSLDIVIHVIYCIHFAWIFKLFKIVIMVNIKVYKFLYIELFTLEWVFITYSDSTVYIDNLTAN